MELFEVSDNLQDPILKAYQWIKEAQDESVALPHAMNLSSLNSKGRPASRMVLLKKISNEGFVFFTDYEGNKGKQIADYPYAAITFWWAKTNKQIRIEGICSKVSDLENDDYFSSRPKGSQIAASVSHQSAKIDSYEALVKKFKTLENDKRQEHIKRPERWGGYLLEPNSIEFWEDQKNRLHKREIYTLSNASWQKSLLSP